MAGVGQESAEGGGMEDVDDDEEIGLGRRSDDRRLEIGRQMHLPDFPIRQQRPSSFVIKIDEKKTTIFSCQDEERIFLRQMQQ